MADRLLRTICGTDASAWELPPSPIAVAHIAAALIAVRDETQLAMLRVPFHGKDVKPDGPYALISDLQEAMKGTREPDRT